MCDCLFVYEWDSQRNQGSLFLYCDTKYGEVYCISLPSNVHIKIYSNNPASSYTEFVVLELFVTYLVIEPLLDAYVSAVVELSLPCILLLCFNDHIYRDVPKSPKIKSERKPYVTSMKIPTLRAHRDSLLLLSQGCYLL